jgi:hypothetical protein
MNFVDPTGHEPKNGEGACYELGCKNANGTTPSQGNGKGGAPTKTLLACGFDAGEDCENTLGYDDLPLAPYYQLQGGKPLIFGVDKYQKNKFDMALAMYNYIKANPGKYNLIGHSAGGTALIILVSWLQRDGLEDQIQNLVLLDPAMDTAYKIDESGNLGNIQDLADAINPSGDPNGIPLFLGDSTDPADGPDFIQGANKYVADVNHYHLATDINIYMAIINDVHWRK